MRFLACMSPLGHCCARHRRVNADRTKFCAFVDATGALRSADCKVGKRLVYCEYDLPRCP